MLKVACAAMLMPFCVAIAYMGALAIEESIA